MRIAVIGAGGAGALIGAMLAGAGHTVEFLVRHPHWEALRTRGLRVDTCIGNLSLAAPVAAYVNTDHIVNPEVVLLAVKAGQVAAVLPNVPRMLGPGTIVVTIQNGIRTVDEVEQTVGANATYAGTCYCVSYLVAPGHVRHVGVAPTLLIGNLSNRQRNDRTAASFVSALRDANIAAENVPEIRKKLWLKLVLTAAIGAIGSLSRVAIGEFRAVPLCRELLTTIMREVVAVATARGIDLGESSVERTLSFVDEMPIDSTSSLQRDITSGRCSELEYIIGDLVRYADESGIQAPATRWAYSCLLPVESKAQGCLAVNQSEGEQRKFALDNSFPIRISR